MTGNRHRQTRLSRFTALQLKLFGILKFWAFIKVKLFGLCTFVVLTSAEAHMSISIKDEMTSFHFLFFMEHFVSFIVFFFLMICPNYWAECARAKAFFRFSVKISWTLMHMINKLKLAIPLVSPLFQNPHALQVQEVTDSFQVCTRGLICHFCSIDESNLTSLLCCKSIISTIGEILYTEINDERLAWNGNLWFESKWIMKS